MKRTAITFFITFLFLILISACKEDVYVDWKIMNDNWYNIHKNDSGFVTTESGLCYKIIFPGWALDRQPNKNSTVVINSVGTLIDGSTFETKVNTLVYLSDASPTTIDAWREMMPKLHTGAHVIFYVPSKIGYDTISTNVAIPPHSVLKYDVTLFNSFN